METRRSAPCAHCESHRLAASHLALVAATMSSRRPGESDVGLVRPGDVLLFNTTDAWIGAGAHRPGPVGQRYLHALAWQSA